MRNLNFLDYKISKKHIAKVALVIFVVFLILIYICFGNKETEKNKILLDKSRISSFSEYSDSVFNSFSFNVDSERKNSLTYNSQKSSFETCSFKNKVPIYKFTSDYICKKDISFEVKQSFNLDIKTFTSIVKNKSPLYNVLSKNLIYASSGNSSSSKKQIVFTKCFDNKDNRFLVSFTAILTETTIKSIGEKDIINNFVSVINDFTSDDNKTPYLQDKMCYINFAGYSIDDYRIFTRIGIDKNEVSFNEDLSCSLVIRKFLNLELNEKVSKNFELLQSYQNVYFDKSNNSIYFILGRSYACISTKNRMTSTDISKIFKVISNV